MELSYLPDAENHPLWPHIFRLLEPAVMADEEVVDPVDIVWVAYEGPTIFGVATSRPEGDEARLRLAAGTRFREWMGLLDAEVSAWARMNGARRLTMRGRKGWARFARAFGWVALSCDEDGRMTFAKEL